MNVLGIESTCDETSASIVVDGRTVLSNVIASSVDIHEKYGGVFPELACRRHMDAIIPVISEALGTHPPPIDLIAVAKGPGLAGALLIGMQVAKGLSFAWKKPFIGIDHVEAHLYSAFMPKTTPWLFPSLGLILSGGHTLMVKILEIGKYELLGTTADDAIGEAFDKVAIMLGLPYPGGPRVEQLALDGNPNTFPFKAGRVKTNPLFFSFSGLKTSVLYALQGKILDPQTKANAAASFQQTAFTDIAAKASLAIKSFPCQAIYAGGGVCNNLFFKTLLAKHIPSLPIFWPQASLTSDNAAMIAGLGYHQFLQNPHGDPLDLDVQTRIPYLLCQNKSI